MSTAFAPVDNVGASPPGHATVLSLPLAWSKVFQLLICLFPVPSCCILKRKLPSPSGNVKFKSVISPEPNIKCNLLPVKKFALVSLALYVTIPAKKTADELGIPLGTLHRIIKGFEYFGESHWALATYAKKYGYDIMFVGKKGCIIWVDKRRPYLENPALYEEDGDLFQI